MKKKWIALFSHTGSEIINISNKLGIQPDKIITNNPPGSKDIHKSITDICYASTKPKLIDYQQLLDEDAIITLHGWMRIIPGSICKSHEIYNLHPGLITKYPELKGMDPQKKVISSVTKTYDHVGCVIHKAIEEVDAGSVIMERSTTNAFYSTDLLTSYLHDMASSMWIEFLEEKLLC